MTKAVLYARYSDRPDAGTSESNAAQLDIMRRHAEAAGWRVAAEFADDAESGADDQRPGLWNAIAALGRGDVLLVYKLDRVARSVALALVVEDAVRRAGARLVSVCGEGTASDSPEDELTRRILQALADYQRKANAARTRAMMQRHAAAGRRMGRHPRYGTMVDEASEPNRHGRPGRTVENPEEQAAMRRAAQLAKRGFTISMIAAALGKEGFKTRKGGAAWHHQAVRRMLIAMGVEWKRRDGRDPRDVIIGPVETVALSALRPETSTSANQASAVNQPPPTSHDSSDAVPQ